MHKQLKITICTILYLHCQIVQTYQIYQLDSKTENELLPKLRKIIENSKNQKSLEVPKNLPKRKPMGKSIFVKRIIPHGYKGARYEYDSKLNTVFKPLVRFHVEKPIIEHERTILKDIETSKTGKDGFNDGLIVLVKKNRNPQMLMQKLKDFLSKRGRNRNRKGKMKKRFRGISGRLDNEIDALRILEKSGEIHDPLAPGKYFVNNEEEDTTTKPKVILPNYPFWNYWTGHKMIIQDECRGNLIKLGDMCVNVIGHRKSSNAIKEPIKLDNEIKLDNPIKLENPRKFIVTPETVLVPKKSRKYIKYLRKRILDNKNIKKFL